MSLTDDINYRQVLSTSMAYRLPGIQDLVFNSNPVTAELRRRGRFKRFDGPEIRVSLMIDKFDGQWIAGYDKFDIQAKEIVNDAVFTRSEERRVGKEWVSTCRYRGWPAI